MGEKGRVFTGCRARFLLAGKKCGYATNVTFSEEIQYDPLEVLDNVEVEEWVPTAYRCTFTAGFVRIVGETIKSEGFFPKTGPETETHLKNILLMKDMGASIEDTATGRIVCVVEGMRMQSSNCTINARGIVAKDATFVATRMKDEAET
jgi:hypothetical protein